jgi:hypothetical protein
MIFHLYRIIRPSDGNRRPSVVRGRLATFIGSPIVNVAIAGGQRPPEDRQEMLRRLLAAGYLNDIDYLTVCRPDPL